MSIISESKYDFINEAVKELESKKTTLNNCSVKLCEIFGKALEKSEAKNKSVVSRVKKSESLKEKIIRKPLKETTGKEYIENLDDIIGVRILCLLNSEESVIFQELSEQMDFLKQKK